MVVGVGVVGVLSADELVCLTLFFSNCCRLAFIKFDYLSSKRASVSILLE